MPKTMWKAKAESAEAQLNYMKAEDEAIKGKLRDLADDIYRLRVINASFQERLRLVKIAASQEDGNN